MRSLVLCDADIRHPFQASTWGPASAGDEAIVVLALNSVQAARGWDSLQSEALGVAHRAAHVARRRPAGKIAVEIAITLPMPEAADHALLRLLDQAPGGHLGPFEEIWLLTGDTWLSSATCARLGPCWDLARHNEGGILLRRFRVRNTRSAWMRKGPEPDGLPVAPTRAPQSPTIVVDSPEDALSVAALPVQGPVGFPVLVREVDQHPSLLTQIGVTTTTTRGVERLARQVSSPSPCAIGPCSAGDGLELEREPMPIATLVPGSANVLDGGTGAGAVRFEWGEDVVALTARTRLPVGVLRAAQAGSFTAIGSQLPDDQLLRQLGTGVSECRVSFVKGPPGRIGCLIDCDPSEQQAPAWWWDGGGRTTAKFYCIASRIMVQGQVSASGQPARMGRELIVRSVLAAGASVTPQHDGRPGDLLCARDGGGAPAALLVLTGSVSAGMPVQVEPIQARGAAALIRLLGKHGPELRRLPLVVPLEGGTSAAAVRTPAVARLDDRSEPR